MNNELNQLRSDVIAARRLAESYPCRTIENIIANIEASIKVKEEQQFGDDKKPQVDGFDAELNALLKKYEHLSKKELQEPLEFYLGVVRDDLDVVREEEKPMWTEEDEKCIDNCCLLIGSADDCYEKSFKDDCIHYLQSLKQRML